MFQDLGKKRLSTQKIPKIIVKAFFIRTMNEDCLNTIHMQKMLFYVTAVVKQSTAVSINEFNNYNCHYNDNFPDTVKLVTL